LCRLGRESPVDRVDDRRTLRRAVDRTAPGDTTDLIDTDGRVAMKDSGFQLVPVPDRFVLRVMSAVAAWEAAEPSGTAAKASALVGGPSVAPGHAADDRPWSAEQLRSVGSSDVKSLRILTQLLDRLANEPGRFYTLADLAPSTDFPHGSVSAAIRKLPAFLRSRYGRDDLPFARVDNTYGLTPWQADQWKRARGRESP
jgi:hypothetical protein